MDIEVLEEFYNPLLERREVRFQVKHPGSATPERFKVRQALREMGICHIYENPENVKYLVPRHIYVKNLPPEERAKLKEAR